jgi:hypothetical protein
MVLLVKMEDHHAVTVVIHNLKWNNANILNICCVNITKCVLVVALLLVIGLMVIGSQEYFGILIKLSFRRDCEKRNNKWTFCLCG